MFWKNKKEEVIVLDTYPKPGTCIPCDNPETVKIIAPDPEPDLDTKPEDVIAYSFGYACPQKHIGQYVDSIAEKDIKSIKVCQICGKIARLCTVKKTAESRWRVYRGCSDGIPRGGWECIFNHPYYSKHEFANWVKITLSKK